MNPNRIQNRLGSSVRGFRGCTVAVVAFLAILTLAGSGANAQTFTGVVIDSNTLANVAALTGCASSQEMLLSHACEPWRAYLRAIKPPPANDRAVVSAAAVLRLCGTHQIKDELCGEAALLELRFHRDPCWKTNRC